MDRDVRRRLIETALALIQTGSLAACRPRTTSLATAMTSRSAGTCRHRGTSPWPSTPQPRSRYRGPTGRAFGVGCPSMARPTTPTRRSGTCGRSAIQVGRHHGCPRRPSLEAWLEQQEPRYADAEWGPLLPSSGVRRMPWQEPPPGMRACARRDAVAAESGGA